MNRLTASFYDRSAVDMPWRTGRKNGRTIYAVLDADGRASDDDIYIGSLDTPDISSAAVEAHNAVRALTRKQQR